MNVAYMLQWSAHRYPKRVAAEAAGTERTFEEIDRRTNALANALLEIGVAKADRVGVLLGNQIEYLEAEFGIAKAGAVRVPMLIKASEEDIRGYVEDSDATVVIASSQGLPTLRAACAALERDVQIIAVSDPEPGEHDFESLVEGSSSAPPQVDLVESDWYAVRYTGGTTGGPKGILMDHGCMVNVIHNMLLDWSLTDDEVVCHFHPLSHAAGMIMYAWWMRGARQVILPAFNFDPDELMSTIERERVTSMFMIPTALNTVLDSGATDRYDHSSLRMIIYGGAPIASRRLEEGLATFGPVFVQIYGSTEAPNALTTLLEHEHVWPPDTPPPAHLRSAGRIGHGVEVKVVDADGSECATGETGEVVSRGPHTFAGYWKNDELTRERVKDGWVHTRDIGYFDDDGYLFLVDRKDDMIISGGFNIWPAEIENVLCAHAGVAEAAVFGLADDRWGEAVTAVVVPRSDATIDADELAEFSKNRLTRYKVPKRIIVRAEPIPKSPVGKPLRRAVREEYANQAASTDGEA
jgi:acyl-CoA synthetase (AMP-forming)/AMP-acid ligase II